MRKDSPLKLLERGHFRKAFFLFLFPAIVCGLFFSRKVKAEDFDLIPELKLYSKAVGLIVQAYVEDLKPRDLFYASVKGMMSSLDRYSMFFSKEQYELLKISMKGEYWGIGAKLMQSGNFPGIAEITPGSAAEKAGLLPKDEIHFIDGKSMENRPIEEVAGLLRDEDSGKILLGLFRPSESKAFNKEIIREKVEIPAIQDVRIIGNYLGYLRIADWNEHTVDQFDAALKKLHRKQMKALIIDLRNNDGGLMPAAIQLAERYIPEGQKIVSVTSKIPEQKQEHISTSKKIEPHYPILILVNQFSASASEIFTSCMQDHKRARALGVKTFGKASVQSVIPLDEFTAMKFTTARYVSPLGRVIDHQGIEPDIVVEYSDPQNPGPDRQTLAALDLFKDYMN